MAYDAFAAIAQQDAEALKYVNQLRVAFKQAPRHVYTAPEYRQQVAQITRAIPSLPLKGEKVPAAPKAPKKPSATLSKDEILNLTNQIKAEKERIKAGGGGGKSIFGHLGDIGLGGLHGLAKAADYLGRGAKFGTTFAGNLLDTNSQVWKDSMGDTTGPGGHPADIGDILQLVGKSTQKAVGAFTGKDKETITGSQLVGHLPGVRGMSGGWQKSAITGGGGFAGDVLLDPTTYATFGATELGAQVAKKTAETLAPVLGEQVAGLATKSAATALSSGAKSTTAKILKDLSGQTISGAARKVGKSEIAAAVAREQQGKMVTESVMRVARQRALAEVKAAKDAAPGHILSVAERRAIELKHAQQVTQPWADVVQKSVQAGLQRKLQVKFLGRDILSKTPGIAKAAYRPFGAGLSLAKAVPGSESLQHAFQMSKLFPGLTERMRRLAESHTVQATEAFNKQVDNVVKGLSHSERSLLSHADEKGIDLSGRIASNGKDLGEVQKFFQGVKNDIFDVHSNTLGRYQAKDYVQNWSPMYLKSADAEAKKAFLEGRKQFLKYGSDPAQAAKYSIEGAKQAGLKPYGLIDDSYKLAYGDMQRQLQKNLFAVDVLNKYGLQTGSKELAAAHGLQDVTDLVPKGVFQDHFNAMGQRAYLHPDIAKAIRTYNDMAKMTPHGNKEMVKFLRFMNRGNTAFKKSATIYNLPNWFNNTMGDLSMNFVDGVTNPKWYAGAVRMLSHEAPTGTIKIAGRDVPLTDLLDLYKTWSAGAGYLTADVAKGAGTRLTRHVQQAYQAREDFGRMAHFLHALNEEAKRIAKEPTVGNQFKPGFQKVLQDAAERAGQRVSKWNIDYSAFTPFERGIKTNVIPFYAWMRKSMPLMMEGIFQKPGRIAALQKAKSAIDQTLGGQQQGDYNPVYPLWLRDAGFMRLSGGREPWVMRDPLPTNVLGKQFGGSGFSDIVSNQLAGVAPWMRIPAEIASGKQFFSGRKMPSSPFDIGTSNFPAMSELSALAGRDLSKVGKPEDQQRYLTGLSRVLSLVGLPRTQVTKGAQLSELRRQQDPLQAQISQMNTQSAPWTVRQTKNGWEVYNVTTKRNAGVYPQAGMAQILALKLAGKR